MAAVSALQIAQWVSGEILGDADRTVERARPMNTATATDLTFAENPRNLALLLMSVAPVAIVPPGTPAIGDRTLILARDPLGAFITAVEKLHPRPKPSFRGVHPTAIVDPTAIVPDDVELGPHAVVGEGTKIGRGAKLGAGVVVGHFCTLGDEVTIWPNAVVYDRCIIGNRVVIHSGTVIGADGFGYRTVAGKHVKVPQLGHVEIGDDVEIGANCAIDRATFGATVVGEGTKVDNLVQIAHNVVLGRHNLIVSQVGIAGSCTTGEYVVIGGQAGMIDHLHIGDRAMVGAQTGITRDVEVDARILGTPGLLQRDQMRIWVTTRKLPEMLRDLQAVKKKLGMEES